MMDPFDFKALERMPKLSAAQVKVLADVRRRPRGDDYGHGRTLRSLCDRGLVRLRRGVWVLG
jgi:hypothetical protein